MILVLTPDAEAPLADAIAKSGDRRGVEVLRFAPTSMLREVTLALEIEAAGARVRFGVDGRWLDGESIHGVVSTIDGFEPALWPSYTPRDQTYAAQEALATWVAAITALPCALLNPPAADALGGAIFTPVEVCLRAAEAGLGAPLVAYLESAQALLDERADEVRASVCALGELALEEVPLRRDWLSRAGDGPIRIRGAGRDPVRAVVVGEHVLTVGHADLPDAVKERLRLLHRRLGRTMGEVWLGRDGDGRWLVEEALRWPGAATIAALGQNLGEAVLDACAEGRRW